MRYRIWIVLLGWWQLVGCQSFGLKCHPTSIFKLTAPDKCRCDRFYTCNRGIRTHHTCPLGTFFKVWEGCVRTPPDDFCNNTSFVCPSNWIATAKYADPCDCSMYWQCESKTVSKSFDCPFNMFFDAEKEKCVNTPRCVSTTPSRVLPLNANSFLSMSTTTPLSTSSDFSSGHTTDDNIEITSEAPSLWDSNFRALPYSSTTTNSLNSVATVSSNSNVISNTTISINSHIVTDITVLIPVYTTDTVAKKSSVPNIYPTFITETVQKDPPVPSISPSFSNEPPVTIPPVPTISPAFSNEPPATIPPVSTISPAFSNEPPVTILPVPTISPAFSNEPPVTILPVPTISPAFTYEPPVTIPPVPTISPVFTNEPPVTIPPAPKANQSPSSDPFLTHLVPTVSPDSLVPVVTTANVLVSSISPSLCLFKNGVFPHPTNCTQYISCLLGRLFIRQCQCGFLFDQELKRCVEEDKAHCGDAARPFTCQGKKGNYPLKCDCTKYYSCQETGQVRVRQCILGYSYQQATKSCVFRVFNSCLLNLLGLPDA